jgi:hypothetical protein
MIHVVSITHAKIILLKLHISNSIILLFNELERLSFHATFCCKKQTTVLC